MREFVLNYQTANHILVALLVIAVLVAIVFYTKWQNAEERYTMLKDHAHKDINGLKQWIKEWIKDGFK